MSTPYIGTNSTNPAQVSYPQVTDSDVLLQYLGEEQSKISQQVLQSQAQGIVSLKSQLQNAIAMAQTVTPLAAEAAALDQQLTWSVNTGDRAALNQAQTQAVSDADAANIAIGQAWAEAEAFKPAAESLDFAASAAASAHTAATTSSPMLALKAAQESTQCAASAGQAAAAAACSASQALQASDAALHDAKDAFGAAQAAVDAAITDDAKTAGQAVLQKATATLQSAVDNVATAADLVQAAKAATEAAGAAKTAAASAQAVAAMLAQPKEIALDDGQRLLLGPEPGHLVITDASGQGLDISGDLHVSLLQPPGTAWSISADSTFVLSNGTKISLDTQNGAAKGLTITRGNQMITVGGLTTDQPQISATSTGGRARDAATNDGHLFTQDGAVWKYDGASIGKGAKLAQTEVTSELALETNDVELPAALLSFLTRNGVAFQDNDADGKLNADELKGLVGNLQKLTSSLSQQSMAEVGFLQKTTQTLLDLSARLQQSLANFNANSSRMEQAMQESQRLAHDLERLQMQKRDGDRTAQDVMKLLTESLEQATVAASLNAQAGGSTNQKPVLSPAEQQRAADELAAFKAGLQGSSPPPPQSPADEISAFQSKDLTKPQYQRI